jgi:hypothetical protein
MKDFLITVLPWCIAATAMAAAGLVYLMYIREKEHSATLYRHWDQSVRLNQVACNHIRALESQLRNILEDDLGEGWKNL